MLVKAYAKINWTLDVLGRRADGYHELDTLMQRISLYDDVELLPSDGIRVSVEGNADIPVGEGNIAFRAAKAYFAHAGLRGAGVAIRIVKRIPSEAGLGGGSADAAAVLRALNDLHGALADPELFDVALTLGADVPFCLAGGAARCRGVGERMEPFAPKEFTLLLVKPAQGVSTKALFSSLDLASLPRPRTGEALAAYQSGDAKLLGGAIGNALSEPAAAHLPVLRALLDALRGCGAAGVSMSGSGSCCFALFERKDAAKEAEKRFSSYLFCAVCNTL